MDEFTRIAATLIYLAVIIYAFVSITRAETPIRRTKLLILLTIAMLWFGYRLFVVVAFWSEGDIAPWVHDFNANLGRSMHIPNGVALLLLVDETRQQEKLQKAQVKEIKNLL